MVAALFAPGLGAQSIADRVNDAPAGAVQFTFAARPGVCGNGRTYIQTGSNNFYGSYTSHAGRNLRNRQMTKGKKEERRGTANKTISKANKHRASF